MSNFDDALDACCTPDSGGIIVAGMPADEYHAHHGIGGSSMHYGLRSMMHLRQKLEGDKHTTAMSIGTALHSEVLETGDAWVEAPDIRRNSNEWKSFEAEHGGKLLLKPAEAELVRGMAAALRSHQAAGKALRGDGEAEVSMFWTDGESGMDCKGRVDRVVRTRKGRPLLIDLKTTNDASSDRFSKAIFEHGYYVQDAHYRAGYAAATGADPKRLVYVVIAVESAPPHAVAMYRMTPETRDAGEAVRSAVLRRLAREKAIDECTGYCATMQTVGLPGWAVRQIDGALDRFEREQKQEETAV